MNKPCVFLSWSGLLLCLLWPHFPSRAQEAGPTVRISSVKTANSRLGGALSSLDPAVDSVPSLSYDQNNLYFGFVNTDDTTDREFHYYLVGLDYAWTKCGECGQVAYAHLSGGEYTFLVKSSEDDPAPAQFRFFVEGDVLHKWWFVPMLVIYAIVFLGVGAYFLILNNFRQKLREQRHIHQEKMASMADLTDGIAHEIMNPLNFVNNYSEVNRELVEEIAEERAKVPSERDEELIDEILTDLDANLEKIHFHGKRADAIVSGMLKHGRRSSGEREALDVNKLVAEYLSGAFETRSAAEPLPGPTIQANYGERLPEVKAVALEIAQVLSNLVNNASDAVRERQGRESGGYVPKITVRTSSQHERVEVRVEDNGVGIPASNLDKVFQPFFTTKPTGKGTGLGLSLSYDIVKANGGELSVESTEGVGTVFLLTLPVSD